MPRMPTLFIQTLPSTVKLAGITIACCATSLLTLGERGKVWNFSVRGSNFTIPPCSIMPCQMFPSLSISISRLPCGKPLWVDRLDLADAALRLERVAARSVARHPHHHLHEFVGIVSGLEEALQRVTADAAADPVLLLFGSRHAHEPFGIGELRGYIGYLAKLEIHRRRRLRRNRDCDRACQIITHSAHGDGVLARVEPVLWE